LNNGFACVRYFEKCVQDITASTHPLTASLVRRSFSDATKKAADEHLNKNTDSLWGTLTWGEQRAFPTPREAIDVLVSEHNKIPSTSPSLELTNVYL
jgi:hypothetical protein